MPEVNNVPQSVGDDQEAVDSRTTQVGGPKEDSLASATAGEIIENMPSYMARGFIYVLVFAILTAVVYAYFGKTDEVVETRGKLVPKGDAAIVHAVKGGLLTRLFVKEGDTVKKGQVLAELDFTKTSIDAQKRMKQYEMKKKQESCLAFAIKVMSGVLSGKNVVFDENEVLKLCSSDYVATIMGMKADYIDYDKAMMQAKELYPPSIKTLHTAIENKQLQLTNRKELLEAAEKDLARTKIQLDLYEEMFKEDLASKVKVMEEQKRYDDALSKVSEARLSLNTGEAELEDAIVKLKTTKAQYDKATEEAWKKYDIAIIKYKSALETMIFKLDELRAELKALELDTEFEEYAAGFDKVLAPVSGVVSQVRLRTPGEIVRAGETIITINPSDQPLVAKVMIPNKSVGRLKEGLKAKHKLDAYPYQDYGVVTGTVYEISPDSRELKDGYFFEAGITLDRDHVVKKGKKFPLFTGLTVVSEIVVERKRIIDHFLAPLKKLQD